MASKILKNKNQIIIVKSKRLKCCEDIINTINKMESKINFINLINKK